MTNEMSRTKLRVKAIGIVNGYRKVLTDLEFVEYTDKASRLRYKAEGIIGDRDTIEEAISQRESAAVKSEVEVIEDMIFGSERDEMDDRLAKHLKMIRILMDEEVPENFRRYFVNNTFEDNWDEFKKSLLS